MNNNFKWNYKREDAKGDISTQVQGPSNNRSSHSFDISRRPTFMPSKDHRFWRRKGQDRLTGWSIPIRYRTKK